LPRWAQLSVLPVLNLLAALLVTGLVTWMIGEDPWECLQLLVSGAFGSGEGIGYTLFYTTGFIFTGLAVATAFHAGLFNIGGEGQAYLAGLGVTLVVLAFDHTLPPLVLVPLCILAAMGFGAAWAFIPGWLQAKRGSHIVVTTIMFNFIAYSLMLYLIGHHLIEAGSQNPTTREFGHNAWIPALHQVAAGMGIQLPSTRST
jgi:simple sugar transport system permease protein